MFRSNIKFFLAFFIATTLFAVVQVYAVWQDAPAAPAQYGAIGSGQEQDDYKPVNLGDTVQTKTGGLNIMGNVGIGTDIPGAKLELMGDGASLTSAKIILSETQSGLGTLFLNSARVGSGNRLDIGEGSDVFLTVRSDDDSGGTTSRGNVGIGTTDPGLYKLNVQGGDINTSGRLCINEDCKDSWDAVGGSQGLQEVTDIGTSTTNVIGAKAFYDSDDPNRNYFIDPFASGIAAIFKGNVGIGVTVAPAYKLDVTGTIRANGGLIIDVRTSDPSSPVAGQIWLVQ